MRKMMAWALGLALAGPAVAQSTARVAVVVGLEPKAISAPTVELYRRVEARLVERGVWRVAGDAEVRQNLAADARLAHLGSIAAVDRRQLGGVRAKGKKMIRPVQAMVDTLALDGAVLVDCKPAKTPSMLQGCSVFYYDRAEARIVAASHKTFQVPIADVTRWAPVLVDQMTTGIEAHRSAKTRDRARQLMEDGDDDANGKQRLAVELGLSGAGVDDPGGYVRTLPLTALAVGAQGETFGASLIGEFGSAQGSDGGVAFSMKERAVGLQFTAQARALERIHWDLGLTTTYAMRESARDSEDAARVGTQKERLVRLKLAPGMLWEFAEDVHFGPAFYALKDVPLSTETSGSFAGSRVRTTSFAIGVRLKAVL